MSDRNWGVGVPIVGSLLAIGLIGWLVTAMIYSMGVSAGSHRAEAQGYAAQYPADTDERIGRCPTESEAALKACVEEAVAAAHDAQRSEGDLNAQRDMAKWAWWLLVVSLGTLFVSGSGLFALIVTIRQGRDGLDRAREANEIARGRPYLGHGEAWFELSFDDSLPVPRPFVDYQISIKNVGQKPAHIQKMRVHFRTGSGTGGGSQGGAGIIAPGAVNSTRAGESFQFPKKGRLVFSAAVLCKYTDDEGGEWTECLSWYSEEITPGMPPERRMMYPGRHVIGTSDLQWMEDETARLVAEFQGTVNDDKSRQADP